jgi:transposase
MESGISLKNRYDTISKHLDEKSRRLWLGNEALAFGRGGITYIAENTGVSRNTVTKGQKEVQRLPQTIITGEDERIREKGGGRKNLIKIDTDLINDLYQCIEPFIRGDPESSLLWTTKSLRDIADELHDKGHQISYRTVGTILNELDFSLQANKKTDEGRSHEDRDQQFLFIYNRCNEFLQENEPVISVDAKKKELIGNQKNNGKNWRLKNNPIKVNVYDFPSMCEKVTPFGIYDITNNKGWINVGIDHDTAEFSVESIRRWWKFLGKKLHPQATKILITADCGGSNGYRIRLWKTELQKFATEENLSISVCHFPPGTSKWNKIEHRLFSFISIAWRGRPLLSYQIMINLIKSAKTRTGLTVDAILDENRYTKGIKITDEEMKNLNLIQESFHGEWNYTIQPKIQKNV